MVESTERSVGSPVVLVVGGAGFVGSRVIAELARRGLRPVSADLLPRPGVPHFQVDVTLASQVADVVAEVAPSAVVHLAYLLGEDAARDVPTSTRVNIGGFLNVLEACRTSRVPRLVYASSVAVYGDQADFGEREITEDDHGRPVLLYGWQKQLNEAVAAHYQSRFGIRCLGLRISTSYGRGRQIGLTAALTQMLEAAERVADYTCPFEPDYRSNLIHVDDAASALAELATAPDPRFDIYNTGGECVAGRQVAEWIRELRPASRIAFEADGRRRPHVYLVSGARLRTEFGLRFPSVRQRIVDWLAGT